MQQSQQLGTSLRDSRRKREEDGVKFLEEMRDVQEVCLEKEKLAWSNYSQEREDHKLSQLKGQKYLDSILKSNSTKAESRLTSVRRWS